VADNDTTEHGADRTFRVPVSTGLFRHWRQLGEAALLLIFYIDRTTRESIGPDGARMGAVYGGKPCPDAHVASAFGCAARTVRRWRNRLAKFGYILQRRTPVGQVISVMRSKKWPGKPTDQERTDVSAQNGQPCPIRADNPVLSERTDVSDPIKTEQGQDKDKKARTATKPADALLAFSGEILKVTIRQDRAFSEGFPHVGLQAEYRKADAWLVAHTERRIKRFSQFMYQWLAKCPAPWFSKQRQEPEWM